MFVLSCRFKIFKNSRNELYLDIAALCLIGSRVPKGPNRANIQSAKLVKLALIMGILNVFC